MDDYILDAGEDDECYDLNYSDDSDSDTNVQIENLYYKSKELKTSDVTAALQSFKEVLNLQGEAKGDWGFKALKQIIKIYFQMNNLEEMMIMYKELLTYVRTAVTRNYSEKSIQSILDYIAKSDNKEFLNNFYETTLHALKTSKNDRLWFNTNLELGKLWFTNKDYGKLTPLIKQLREFCSVDEDGDKKNPLLLEVFALEMQMFTEQKNYKKLKLLYAESKHVQPAITRPHIMGIIRECGGKMHLREKEYVEAHSNFFLSFKEYDELGSPRRINCLKYLILANMLMMSKINPFDSPEAKPYSNHTEITGMMQLLQSYLDNDIDKFLVVLHENNDTIMNDPFVKENIDDLVYNIRIQSLINLVKPYKHIKVSFIAEQMKIDVDEVERLLVFCILEESIIGKIDQINQVLIINPNYSCEVNCYHALDTWQNAVGCLHSVVADKLLL